MIISLSKINKKLIVSLILQWISALPGAVLITFYAISIYLLVFNPLYFICWVAMLTFYQLYIIGHIGFYSHVGLNLVYEYENINWKEKYESEKTPTSLNWDEIILYGIITNYKEKLKVLRETLDAMSLSSIAKTHVVPVLAMEEREKGWKEKALRLISEYKSKFKDIIYTTHPHGVEGERAGKSSNENYATRQLQKHMTEKGFKEENVLISIADADSIIHKNYFESVVQLFCCSTDRYRTTWQAPILNFLNIDKIPVFSRIMSYSVTAEGMSNLACPHEENFPFSTYTISYRTAKEVDYWDPDVCAEDWHMYLKTCFAFGDEYNCVPIFLPVNCYSVGESDNYWKGVKTISGCGCFFFNRFISK